MAAMTESALALDQHSKRYPLSFTQEWFVTLDQGDDAGAFGRRFMMVCPIREVSFRTNLADCTSFRDIVARTKETCEDDVVDVRAGEAVGAGVVFAKRIYFRKMTA
jgi:hypothetical protein